MCKWKVQTETDGKLQTETDGRAFQDISFVSFSGVFLSVSASEQKFIQTTQGFISNKGAYSYTAKHG